MVKIRTKQKQMRERRRKGQEKKRTALFKNVEIYQKKNALAA